MVILQSFCMYLGPLSNRRVNTILTGLEQRDTALLTREEQVIRHPRSRTGGRWWWQVVQVNTWTPYFCPRIRTLTAWLETGHILFLKNHRANNQLNPRRHGGNSGKILTPSCVSVFLSGQSRGVPETFLQKSSDLWTLLTSLKNTGPHPQCKIKILKITY